MQSEIDANVGRYEVRTDLTAVGDDAFITSAQWVDARGAGERRYVVLTVRDGMIADMQVCGTRRQAQRFANRRRVAVSG